MRLNSYKIENYEKVIRRDKREKKECYKKNTTTNSKKLKLGIANHLSIFFFYLAY